MLNCLPSKLLPQGVKLEDVPCPHGCPDGDTMLFDAADRINGLPGRFTLVRCNCCGLVRTNPRPTAETMGFYYPDNYGPYMGTKVTIERRGLSKALRGAVRRLIDFRAHKVPNLSSGKALEIGCASGGFLAKLSSYGWSVTGLEFSPTAAVAARQQGFNVIQGALEDVNLPKETFDLVVGWMVLEHLHHPITALRKLHEAAKPGAWLVLSVPNCTGGLQQFGPDWFPLHVPNHLFHFSRETLGKLLQAGGWEIRRCMQQRVLIDWPLSMALKLQSRNLLPWLSGMLLQLPNGAGGLVFNVLCYPLAVVQAARGKGSRMTVWAKRKDAIDC